jgi:hypothetical protein
MITISTATLTMALDFTLVNATTSVSYNPTWSNSGAILQLLQGVRGATFDMNSQAIM